MRIDGTTSYFLDYFGLETIDQLPDLNQLDDEKKEKELFQHPL